VRRKARNPAQRLRLAVDALPRRTRIAMLRGIHDNDIVVGAYTDRASGGICPMLAAHRNGGRTNLASFARAWDRFTGARRPRLASGRELRALTSYIELSLLRDEQGEESIATIARRIRAERAERGHPTAASPRARHERPRPDTGERHRARELRRRRFWSWLLPTRRYDEFADRVASAEEQLSDQRAGSAPRPADQPGASRDREVKPA
jgi:hypothetical protein